MRPWGVVMWYGLVCEVIFDGGRTGRNFFVVCFFGMKNNVWRTQGVFFVSVFFHFFVFSVVGFWVCFFKLRESKVIRSWRRHRSIWLASFSYNATFNLYTSVLGFPIFSNIPKMPFWCFINAQMIKNSLD